MIWLIKMAMYALLPRTETLPGLVDMDLDGFLRRMAHESHSIFWTGVVLGAVLFALTPVLTVGVPLPAFWLPARLRERHTERLLSHRWYLLRQGMAIIRMAAGMCWGADPGVRACLKLSPYGADPGTFRTS
jgi:hypothetical protein